MSKSLLQPLVPKINLLKKNCLCFSTCFGVWSKLNHKIYVSPQRTCICWGMLDDSSQNQKLTWHPGTNIHQMAVMMTNKRWNQSQTLKNEILNNAFDCTKKSILESKRSLLELAASYLHGWLPSLLLIVECLCKEIYWFKSGNVAHSGIAE